MVCTAPAEPALSEWLDADAAAVGHAAGSTPPVPAAVAVLVLNLCMKPSLPD
jgi:hypothetical protein